MTVILRFNWVPWTGSVTEKVMLFLVGQGKHPKQVYKRCKALIKGRIQGLDFNYLPWHKDDLSPIARRPRTSGQKQQMFSSDAKAIHDKYSVNKI